MELLKIISAILLTIEMAYFEVCVGEDIKTTQLGSDLHDFNYAGEDGMQFRDDSMKYRLLSIVEGNLFVGGKNVLMTKLIDDPYDTTLEPVITKFNVCEPSNDIECTLQNKKDACYNYIRVLTVLNETRLFVCGSNALYPRCYHLNYTMSDDNKLNIKSVLGSECDEWDKRDHSGVDFTPFNWDSEMVHMFSSGSVDQLFSGGARKMDKRDSVICHIQFIDGYPSETSADRVCTAVGSEFLNKASYVGKPVELNGATYFFYREFAEEYINHGKIIYSRVGRICNNDTGGIHDSLDGKLISFIKARLDCSISGDYDKFFFNELRDIYQSTKEPNIIYAVFTTPKLSLQQSAVCRFDLHNIEKMMNTEMFRGQEGINDLWLPVTDLPYRPGVCADPIPKEGYVQYWDVNLIDPFVENLPKVETGVPTPMFILQNVVYTSIVVEDLLTNNTVYILGTDNGTIFMAYIDEESQEQIFHKVDFRSDSDDEEPDEVTDLSIHYYPNTTFVYGSTNGRVFGFELANCVRYLQNPCTSNPYCAWMEVEGRCSSIFKNEDGSNEGNAETENKNDAKYENFKSQAVCEIDSVVLKFAQNSPLTCLKQRNGTCHFYLVASVKNSANVSLSLGPQPSSVNVADRNVTGSLFKHFYYTIVVTVEESANYTFQLNTASCSLELQYQVSVDESDIAGIDGKEIEEFDKEVERYRYCLYRWPQENAEKCQSRIMMQEKKGKTYFPRPVNSKCSFVDV